MKPNPYVLPSAHSFARAESALSEVEGDLGEPREDRQLLHRKQRNVWLASLFA